jgi:hypothetical protein
MVWVIKKGEYYVNPNFRVLLTGHADGFICYNNKETMQRDLNVLGEGYYSEYIRYNDIPDGERIKLN